MSRRLLGIKEIPPVYIQPIRYVVKNRIFISLCMYTYTTVHYSVSVYIHPAAGQHKKSPFAVEIPPSSGERKKRCAHDKLGTGLYSR